jgi:hypothetical protein
MSTEKQDAFTLKAQEQIRGRFAELSVLSQISKLETVKVWPHFHPSRHFCFFFEWQVVDHRIQLNGCSLRTIEGLDSNQRIEYLYLRSNYLESIPRSMQFEHLRILDISHNSIQSLSFLGQMPELRV